MELLYIEIRLIYSSVILINHFDRLPNIESFTFQHHNPVKVHQPRQRMWRQYLINHPPGRRRVPHTAFENLQQSFAATPTIRFVSIAIRRQIRENRSPLSSGGR